MKTLLIAGFFLANIAQAANTPTRDVPTEIAYQGNASRPHRYWLTEEKVKKTSTFKLNFEDERKQIRSRAISKTQADFILNQATQIVWENQYLSTKQKVARCTPYARLASGGEQSKVCVENRKAAAQSYGLFNAVRGLFR